MIWNMYPYTDFHNMNQDWIIRILKAMEKKLDDFVATNSIKYANPFQWNITSQYEKNTLTIDAQSGIAYLSVQAVPAGVSVTNTSYWTPVFDLGQLFLDFNKNFTGNDEQLNIVASTNYAVGDWLIWKNLLYEVIAPIVTGNLLVINTNIKRITVESVIDIMNTMINNNTTKINNMRLINVVDYGADPTGATDSLAAIVSALDNDYCTVFFPQGTYKISDKLPDLRHNNIKGDGRDVTKLVFENLTGDCITFKDWRCSLKDLSITTSTTNYAVKCDATASDFLMQNCIINGLNGIDIQGPLDCVRDCYIKCPNGVGINTASSDSSQALYNVAIGSELADMSDNGIGIKINGGCSSLTIEGCDVILKKYGIYIDASSNIFSLKIFDNFIDNSVESAIYVDGAAGVFRSEIKNNWLSSNKYGIYAGTATIDGLDVKDNDFFINSISSIHIEKSETVIIDSNKFSNGSTAIDLYSAQTRVRITNNIIGTYGGLTGMTVGVSYYGGVPSYALVADNDFTGCANAIFGSPGTTVFRDNVGYP